MRLESRLRALDFSLERGVPAQPAEPPNEPPKLPELAFYGGLLSRPVREQMEATALALRAHLERKISGLRLTVQPQDVLDRGLGLFPKELPLVLELDVSSLVPAVYLQQAPHHHPEQVNLAAQSIRKHSVRWGVQLSPGLPGSTPERELDSLPDLLSLRPDFVRLTPALVLRGTRLEAMVSQGTYSPWDIETTIRYGETMLDELERSAIPVVRFGLQPQRDLHLAGNQLVGGPFHPSIRTLIESRRMLRKLETLLSRHIVSGQRITFRIHPSAQTAARGPENENFCLLCRRFRCTSIHLRLDPSMREGALELDSIEHATFDRLTRHRTGEWQK